MTRVLVCGGRSYGEDGLRVVVVPNEELLRIATDTPLAHVREIMSDMMDEVDAVMAQINAMGSIEKIEPARSELPRGPSTKPILPPPNRTGLREAARRRRQMETRRARAAGIEVREIGERDAT